MSGDSQTRRVTLLEENIKLDEIDRISTAVRIARDLLMSTFGADDGCQECRLEGWKKDDSQWLIKFSFAYDADPVIPIVGKRKIRRFFEVALNTDLSEIRGVYRIHAPFDEPVSASNDD